MTMTTVAEATVQIKKEITIDVRMPPGEYYLTDPCYCFEDKTWSELCDLANVWQEPENVVTQFRGKPLLSFNTENGDGCYTDNEGFEYGVDSGMIGLVPVEIADNPPPEGLSRKVSFLNRFLCSRSPNGTLMFRSIRIETNED